MGADGSKSKRTGADGSRNQPKEYFTPEEHSTVSQAVRQFCRGETIDLVKLEKHTAEWLNRDTASRFMHLITKDKQTLSPSVAVDNLGPLLKGSLEQRLYVTVTLAEGNQKGVDSEKIVKYTEVILSSYLRALSKQTQCKAWKCQSKAGVGQVAEALLFDLLFSKRSVKEVWGMRPPKMKFSYDDFEQWCLGHTIFTTLESEVLKGIFSLASFSQSSVLPQASQLQKGFSSILTGAEVLFLNSHLPTPLQSEWRFIFSTTTHGWSFSIFMKQIVGKGPTLIILKDQSDNKFGGFASVPWEVRPQFQGSPECFLFALSPQAGIFHSTGYNNNFMYLNYLEKNTMPNGLGMGGREELFGLWMDYDFGKGSVAPTCTTFRSPQLSPNTELQLQCVEVWALGPEEEDSDEEEGTRKKKSALDKNPDARALLDMIGKEAVSDGYREEEEDQD